VPTLFLLRHAKSSWDDTDASDHDRELAPRGRRATKVIARYLRQHRVVPMLVLCSSARRAVETLAGLRGSIGSPASTSIEDELYGATAAELLERLRRVPDGTESVLLIGHNPGLQDLGILLAGGGDRDAVTRLRTKLPTAALVALDFDGRWRELGPAAGTLRFVVAPRDLG
jgi:phosphohistidine phosphatase